MTHAVPATVTAEGALHLTAEDRRALQQQLRRLAGHRVEVAIRKAHPARSVQQNRWYWGVILAALADHTGYTPDEMHAYLKDRFLPDVLHEVPRRRHLVIADTHGELRDERDIDLEWSTATLTTAQMTTYTDAVRDWAARDLGVNIPDPNGA
jgi:hypothetical protein